MTLGEALKKARKQLGLNQSEMSSNVISTAFYSKVERGEYDLDTMKLIKILTIHQINPIKFFKQIVPLSSQRVANDLYSHDEIHKQILTAFTKQDLIKIEAIQKYCKMNQIEDLYYQTVFLEAALKHDLKMIPNKVKEKAKKYLFKKEDWNDEFLTVLTNSLAAFDIDEASEQVHSVIKKYSKDNLLTNNTTYLLSSICVNYLSLVYFNHSKNFVREEAIYFLRSLPERPENCFAKIMANYYEEIFNNDWAKVNSILSFMEENGLNNLARNISIKLN